MRVALNCPKCGASMAGNLPDTVLPAGWTIHHQETEKPSTHHLPPSSMEARCGLSARRMSTNSSSDSGNFPGASATINMASSDSGNSGRPSENNKSFCAFVNRLLPLRPLGRFDSTGFVNDGILSFPGKSALGESGVFDFFAMLSPFALFRAVTSAG